MQTPDRHMRKSGCPKCGSESAGSKKKLNLDYFIKVGSERHKNKYDYSEVSFSKITQKVKIFCPNHGFFFQRANSHLSGSGCPECSKRSERCSEDEFVSRAKNYHGDKYIYDNLKYSNLSNNVEIECLAHGFFTVNSYKHLLGKGCKECNRVERQDKFIKKAIDTHGDKYDYSLAFYKGSLSLLKIICKNHGIFEQSPNHHVSNSAGCPKCSIKAVGRTIDQFIEVARAVHGDKYDYSLVDYIRNDVNVEIICPKHGIFKQAPSSHHRGRGCTICSNHLDFLEIESRLKESFGDEITIFEINLGRSVIFLDKRGVKRKIGWSNARMTALCRISYGIRSSINRAIKGSSHKYGTIVDLIGCTILFLREYLEKMFIDGMQWSNWGEWHIDHIVPCSYFNLSNEDDQKICFNYRNLQPLWAKDNLIKSCKLPENHKEIIISIREALGMKKNNGYKSLADLIEKQS
jgi:hypothetical protein